MKTLALGFVAGVWWLHRQADLPGHAVLLCCLVLGLGCVAFAWFHTRTDADARVSLLRLPAVFLAALLFGVAWSGWRAHAMLADFLPMSWEQRDVEVVGVVEGLPRAMGDAVRFVFKVESAEAPVPQRIQLSWFPPRRGDGPVPHISPGERWQLTVRLRRPHGFANPHGFDYEAWLLERGIRATGYVREQGLNQRVDAFVPGLMNAVHLMRAKVRARYLSTLDDRPYAGILVALAVGDQQSIDSAHWEVFRRTGVAHLVSISGLHVSLVALFVGGGIAWCWRRVPYLCLRLPARKAAATAGFLAAAGYALMAGLGLPAQRALLMLAVVVLALLVGRETQGGRILALALLVVLLVEPFAVLSSGLWLSFGAVATILLVVSGRLKAPSGWRAAVRIQLAISLATVPPLLALFNGFSLISPVANAWAIPLVSFAIAPAALLALIVPFSPLLEWAHGLVSLMMSGLEYLSGLSWALWHRAALPPLLIGLAMVSAMLLLLPRGTPAKLAALAMLLPVLWWAPARPQPGEFRAVVMDVGQGLAIHVQTAGHDLIFDTGPSFGPEADAGSRVLVPYLAALGVRRLDMLIISHGDSDHIGGARSLMQAVPVEQLVLTPSETHPELSGMATTQTDCVAGAGWTWDEVRFEWLHPGPDAGYPRANDHSCVLSLSTDAGTLLLTGDIEAIAERHMLARNPTALQADVLTAPHHGSQTSSTPAFVSATGAAHVIHSVGKLNAFRHPHPAVWARWSASGARNWRTDAQGAVIVDMQHQGVSLSSQREIKRRYWHGR